MLTVICEDCLHKMIRTELQRQLSYGAGATEGVQVSEDPDGRRVRIRVNFSKNRLDDTGLTVEDLFEEDPPDA